MVRRFYPSVTLALGIRFDEALHYIRGQATTPSTEIARREPDPLGFVDPPPAQEPLFVSSGNSDALSWLVNIVPRSASCTKASYRDAGTFEASIGYHELPFDPRLIKAMQVRVFAGCIDPADFAQGVTQRVQIGNGRVLQVLRPSVLQGADVQGHPRLDLLAMWGIADDAKLALSENPTWSVSGRDLRSLFLSSPMRRSVLAQLDLTQPIDRVVKQIVDLHPLGAQMQVVVQASDWPGGRVPSPGAEGSVTKVHLGASGKKKSGPPPAQQESKLDWWGAICQYCYLVGAVPYFRGVRLEIRPATSLYDLRDNVLDARTPFAGQLARRGPNGAPFAVRKLIVGHNVKALNFRRNFQGPQRPRVIEVISLDTSSQVRGKQKLLRAVWPEDLANALKKKHATKESPSGQLAESEVQRVPVPGIRDQGQLREVAKAIWETHARMEVEGDFETPCLASYLDPREDANADPDLISLEVGDPVELSVAESMNNTPLALEVSRFAGKSFNEAVLEVSQQTGDENFARALVATSRNLIVETEAEYRVSQVKLDWSITSGLRVSGQFQNFIQARYGAIAGAPPPAGQRATATTQPQPKTPSDVIRPSFPFDT